MPLSTQFSIAIKAPSALQTACLALASGQSANFPAGAQSSYSLADVEWQGAFHHDGLNDIIHLMGKPANNDGQWKHQTYNVATGAWTLDTNDITIGGSGWNYPGHIYGNTCIDDTTGDLYQTHGGMTGNGTNDRRAGWWKAASPGWNNAPVNQAIFSGAMESHMGGLGWHPNMFGPGDGGYAMMMQEQIMFWRKANDAVFATTNSTAYYGNLYGQAAYSKYLDFLLIGGGDTASPYGHLAKVKYSGTPGAKPTVTDAGLPPIATQSNTRIGGPAGGFGSLHVHPGNGAKFIILGTVGTNNYWTSLDGTNWTLAGQHPFAIESASGSQAHVVCALKRGLGCFWCVGVTDAGAQVSTLWRPPL